MANENIRALKRRGVGTMEEISLPNEEWRDIPIEELKGLYFVSSLGRVYSPARKRKSGLINQPEVTTPPLLIVGSISKGGYRRFTGVDRGGKKYYLNIHVLIATAFIPNPENKPQVNHKKGIKLDNRASELEWVTRSENTIHAIVTGLWIPNEKNTKDVLLLKDCAILEFKGLNKAAKSIGSCAQTLRKYANTDMEVRGYRIAI